MTIVLTYTEEDDTQQQVEFEEDVIEIDLASKRIASIDLTPLATCISLQKLVLDFNQLQSIELTPLATCTSLEFLNLDGNHLQSLDLTPLATCTSLYGLYLHGNQLQSLDLTPLATCTSLEFLNLAANQLQSLDLTSLTTCTNLKELTLHGNQIQSIDLTPLATCTSLRLLDLSENQLQSLDLIPLATCTSLQSLNLGENKLQSIDVTPLATLTTYSNLTHLLYDNPHLQLYSGVYSWLRREYDRYKRPISTYPWSFLRRAADQFGTDRRVQQDILCAMGCRNYGFIDCDLSDLFLSIPADSPIEMAREQVRKKLLEEITRIVDTRGATTGLNVEELSAYHWEIAKRIQRIIELREAEMQRVIVGVINTGMDLRELWLTAYGFEVLTALEMRLTTNLKGLEKVKTAFSELGFELKTGKTSRSGVKMSDELKQAIWWIAEKETMG